MKIRDNAVIVLATGADHSANTGKAVLQDGTLAAANANGFGVVLESDSGTVTIAVAGGFRGTLELRAGAAITKGQRLGTLADGTFSPAATTVTATALENAATGELFEGVIYPGISA
jgi:Na+/phosphate symporter